MKSYKVLNISNTPIVNAPGFLSFSLNNAGISSDWYYLNDYSKPWSVSYGKKLSDPEIIIHLINEYSHVIIHNILNPSIEEIIFKKTSLKNKKIFRHLHSPIKENPINLSFEEIRDLSPKSTKFSTLPTFHFYSYYRHNLKFLPNILPDNLGYYSDHNVDKFKKCIFSPSHLQNDSRNIFSQKVSSKIKKIKNIDIIKNKKFEELLKIRSKYHYVIDELFSSGFNRTTLEALQNGNSPINNCTVSSEKIFLKLLNINENMPMVRANESTVYDLLEKNISLELFATSKKNNTRYFKKFLNEDRMIKFWKDYLFKK